MSAERLLPFLVLAGILILGAAPLMQACSDSSTTLPDQGVGTGSKAKLQAACSSYCQCLAMSTSAPPDVANCLTSCTSMSQYIYYPTSFFGSTTPSDACLDCIASISCAGDSHECDSLCTLPIKLQAACDTYCQCTALAFSDRATCVAGCTNMSQYIYYPTSFFGSTTPSNSCLDCIASWDCSSSASHMCDSLCL